MTWYVVDGTDGSGKTTVAIDLQKILESEGRKVLRIEHPNRSTRIGRTEAELLVKDGKIATIMAIILYVMDVVRSIALMKRKKNEYDDFVFVRYIMATAYLPMRLARIAYKVFEFVLPIPDERLLVVIDEKTAIDRIVARGGKMEVFETEEKLRSTREKMIALSDGWDIIDNSGDYDETLSELRRAIGRRSQVPAILPCSEIRIHEG